MNIFIDHVGDGHKHYRMAITSILYNECLRRRCVTKKGNVAQVEFYNTDDSWRIFNKFIELLFLFFCFSSVLFQKSEGNRSMHDAEKNMPRRHSKLMIISEVELFSSEL